jgi:hypothetical protein
MLYSIQYSHRTDYTNTRTPDHTAPLRLKHAHMHTQPERGLETALADQIQRSFAWVLPLTSNSRTDSDDEFLAGSESIT